MSRDLLHLIGALALLGYGLGSLFVPHLVARLIAQELNTPRGIAEFRVVNGGYFAGLSGFAILGNYHLLYLALGIGWLGAAVARMLAFLIDKPKKEPIYFGLLIFEIAMGLMLVV